MTGKGLAFLNKKSWHTSTLANQERVWKAEQVDAAEKKKIEQLKREKLEERKVAELREMSDLAAGVKRQQRVDWLYEQPVSKTTNEEYLLGKKVENWGDVTMDTAATAVSSTTGATSSTAETPAITEEKPGSLWIGDKLDPTVDTASKIRDDPMFLIKQRERDALKQILENPMQMKLLRDQVKSKKEAKKLKKLEKKEKKHTKSNSVRNDSYRRGDRRHEPVSNNSSSSSTAHRRDHDQRDHSPRRGDAHAHRHERHRDADDNDGTDTRHRHAHSRKRSRSRSPSPDPDAQSKSRGERFVNKNYEFYKKMADDRASAKWTKAPKRALTDAEREERLTSMANDADTHERARNLRLKRAKEQDEQEAAALAARRPDSDLLSTTTPNFIADVNKQVYSGGGVANLADRLSRDRHFVDRTQGRGD